MWSSADDDGVVIVPKRRQRGCRGGPAAREQKEAANRKRLAAGELGLDIYGMREPLAKAGLQVLGTRAH